MGTPAAPAPDRKTVLRDEARDGHSTARALALGLVLVLLLALAHAPVFSAGFVWDDDGHVTPPALRGLDGLARIWTEPAAAQQYYPLVHTLFWIEHRLFGDAPLGYHVVNLALHAGAALLLVRLLLRLRVPGAWLAGALWALHPLQVESVAWISEQKNTLSACFYFAAWLAWTRFDAGLARGERRYGAWAAFALLAVAAVLSKTVTCTLVPAILLVTWAREGGRSWLARAPWVVLPFLLSAGFAALTPFLEHAVGGAGTAAHPSDLQGLLSRLVVAGKDLWFYLLQLATFWDRVFVPPRWLVETRAPWELLAFAVLAGGLALVAGRTGSARRAIAAGFLFFAGTLVPALGFFDAIPFRYSFVADHFQYLAGLGPIVLAAAGGALLARRAAPGGRAALYAAALVGLGALAFTSARHARDFRDAETLWRATVARNPGAWMAWENLVDGLNRAGRFDEAIAMGRAGREHHPERPGLALNLGIALQNTGRGGEALACFDEAVAREPGSAKAHLNRGSVLIDLGRHADALDALARASELEPRLAGARMLAGNALLALGRAAEAEVEHARATELDPDCAPCWFNLGVARMARKDDAAAAVAYERALALDEHELGARLNLAVALARQGLVDRAQVEFERVVRDGAGTELAERARQGLVAIGRAPTTPAARPAPELPKSLAPPR
ncbi:MAG: tetratricopeptide repeat protein [Planctomycetes bacterium]|nr:tetratricopeptide repeat protein [Planctomycetota bacterium]